MIVSVPSAALGAEPVTGASMNAMPRSARRAPISCAAWAPIVDMSTHSSPSRSIWSSVAATCGPSTSIVKSTSASSAASAGVSATRAPCSAAHASAFDRVRFQTVSSCPARARCTACSDPMIPRPSQATRTLGQARPGHAATVIAVTGVRSHPADRWRHDLQPPFRLLAVLAVAALAGPAAGDALAGSFSISHPALMEPASGTLNMPFTISYSGASNPFTPTPGIDYRVVGGDATEGADFDPVAAGHWDVPLTG